MARKKPDPKSFHAELEVAPAGLEGKKALEPEVVRWVARNIDIAHPDPNECPDPFAWTLLRNCRADTAFQQGFIDKLWAKLIPSRSQLDTTSDSAIDGKPTLDLIKRIQAMRDKAEGGAKTQRDPASPETPSAFAAFNPEEE